MKSEEKSKANSSEAILEEELKNRYLRMFMNIPCGFAVLDSKQPFCLKLVNSVGAKAIGLDTDADISSAHYSFMQYVSRDDAMILEERFKILVSDGGKTDFQFRISKSNGSDGWLNASASCIEYYDGSTVVFLVFSDITSFKESELAAHNTRLKLDSALQDASVAAKSKGELLSRMSYELRTPISTIIGLASIAEAESGNPEAVGASLGKITKTARLLLSLVNDILDLNRLENGSVVLANDSINMLSFLASTEKKAHAIADDKGVSLSFTAVNATEPCLLGDKERLNQILEHIIDNAVKFTPAGGRVSFSVEQTGVTDNKAALRFVISDNGIGIGKDFLPHIYDAFAQESVGSPDVNSGVGLGLSICRRLVDIMKGKLEVTSIKNAGTEFTFCVSLAVGVNKFEIPRVLSELNAEKYRALILSSDAVLSRQIRILFKEIGLRSELSDSVDRAIYQINDLNNQQNTCKFVVIDNDSEQPDDEKIGRLKAVCGKHTCFIAVTDKQDKLDSGFFNEMGYFAALGKPVTLQQLCGALEGFFQRSSAVSSSVAGKNADFSGKKVLLVEDHPLNAEIACRLLESRGFEVTTATNGLHAIENFASSPLFGYSAILMDIRMPVMDGLTAARNIRQMQRKDCKTVPIIAMTANAYPEDYERSIESGMDTHIAKPFDTDMLFDTLANYIF